MARPRTLIEGYGVNDADYITQPSIVLESGKRVRSMCLYYRSWTHMLQRVYSEREHIRNPHTVGTSVCTEWLYFTQYKLWMELQVWSGNQLDKDILVVNNKHYSPETCAFVPQYINALLGYRQEWRLNLPFGVSERPYRRKDGTDWTNPYTARCCIGNKQDFKHLGYFATPMEAHEAWQIKKIEQILNTIKRYKTEPCYRKDIEDALMKRVNQLSVDYDNKRETTFL